MHHTFADDRYDLFWKAFKDCTVMQVNLTKENAAELIDKALIAAISERRPVLITLPIGVHLERIKAPKSKLKIEKKKSNKE